MHLTYPVTACLLWPVCLIDDAAEMSTYVETPYTLHLTPNLPAYPPTHLSTDSLGSDATETLLPLLLVLLTPFLSPVRQR